MNRRSFLHNDAYTMAPRASDATHLKRNRDGFPAGSPLITNGDLTPYTPSSSKPWDERRAAHLLRRIGFGPTWDEVSAALTSTPSAIVDAALGANLPAAAPGSWVTDNLKNPNDNAVRSEYAGYARDMQEWWVNLMLQPQLMLREKMVLFWHNHFVSAFDTVLYPQFMYAQNQLYRQYAFGDFRDLAKKVTIDPAMLIYLDGATSKAGNPNENYARELMELFTLGVGAYTDGTPHYTEHDIVELARALTGWTIHTPELYSEFKPARFDNGNKTIFGESANFGTYQGSADVIDHIFNQSDRDLNRKRAAVFICSKLYQYFVYDVPDMAIVSAMAATLESGNWQIGPVLKQLLTSEHFFDENVFGAKIMSPVYFTLGAFRQFKLAAPMNRANVSVGSPETHDPVTVISYLTQVLFNPPNVKGWLGGRTWISSATIPLRIRYAQFWLEPLGTSLPYNFDPVAWVKSLPDAKTDVTKLLDHILDLLLPLAITGDAKAPLLDEILGGGPTYEWDPDAANAAARIRACLIRIANLGEYQLM
jgi:uncharacterized protein (DUF1800 family)